MNVANLSNCQKLYELSGWGWHHEEDATEYQWCGIGKAEEVWHKDQDSMMDYHYPAYSLDYLLDKLPKGIGSNYLSLKRLSNGDWEVGYRGHWITADNPTDAACLLACRLIEEGVIDVKA